MELIGSLTATLCIVVCIVLFIFNKSKDKNGYRIEIKNNTPEEKWKLSTWIAGVFVAGTGVALMYAPSDITGYVSQGLTPKESIIMMTLLNGAPVWSLYSIVGLWYMKHWESKVGKIAAILSTLLGMAISLWTGTNTILRFIGVDFAGMKFLIAFVIVVLAIISAKFNLLKRVSIISFSIFVVAFLVLLSVSKSEFNYTPVTGSITSNFWKEYFTGPTAASWTFWFISWTPTVSRWLAQISKGRTMREYIGGTMILPTALALVWMIISWTHQDLIMNFNLINNARLMIPCIIFIMSGVMFMVGTLDSDCKVFTEDLEVLSNHKLKRRSLVVPYGVFVLSVFCLFVSGIIVKPFEFNEYSSLVFMPLVLWSLYESIRMIKVKRS